MFMKKMFLFISLLLVVSVLYSQQTSINKREKLLMDFGWRFAYGHPFDTKKILAMAPATFLISQKPVMAMVQQRRILMIVPGAN